LDANVLIPALLRDTLLRAAAAGLYMPRWTTAILAELARNLVATGRVTHEGVERLLDAMTEQFADALVTEYEHLIEVMPNNPKDRHVLAAAIVADANILVTNNLRDFPIVVVQGTYGITPKSSDDFLQDLLATDPDRLIEVVRFQASRYANPPLTIEELLDSLANQVPGFALAVRQRLNDEYGSSG
jgi:predicted nucleic acid-binding protein